jgi:hypothetical protein
MSTTRLSAVFVAVLVALSVSSGTVHGQTGGAAPGASQQQSDNKEPEQKDKDFGDKCRPGIPIANEIADAACDVVPRQGIRTFWRVGAVMVGSVDGSAR